MEEPTLSVGDLCAGIGRALRRAYPEAVWVRGEIANKRLLPQGHVFFDLVDAGGDEGARVKVVLWRTDRAVVNNILRRSGHAVRIDDGTEVRIRADVGWHPRHGNVQLRMLAIDTAYTLGRLAEARELLVRTLDREGLLGRQAGLDLAVVPLRVGLVTSAGSAAAADFLDVLSSSAMAWRVALVDTRVQGDDAEASVVRGLAAAVGAGVDVVCIVRGGGSRTDLATFDRETVARAIAGCATPVLTGVGHEIDSSVADLVAHRSFTTPTACASFLVERIGAYREASGRAWDNIRVRAMTALDRANDQVLRERGAHGGRRPPSSPSGRPDDRAGPSSGGGAAGTGPRCRTAHGRRVRHPARRPRPGPGSGPRLDGDPPPRRSSGPQLRRAGAGRRDRHHLRRRRDAKSRGAVSECSERAAGARAPASRTAMGLGGAAPWRHRDRLT